MTTIFNNFQIIILNRHLVRAMAIREIRNRFAGTAGGFAWSVANPLAILLVYWFVFSVGFRVQDVGNIPFVVMFAAGLIPWTIFSESLMRSTTAITDNRHLATKTVFPTEILPVVHMASGLLTHCIMLLILLVLIVIYRLPILISWLQVLYYLAALMTFCLGLSWLLSALNVFLRDVREVLTVLLNLWFWMTPIVWDISMIPEKFLFLFKLNPMYYVINGYKESFLYGTPLWQDPGMTLYFWGICIVMLLTGALAFKNLKPVFAEAL